MNGLYRVRLSSVRSNNLVCPSFDGIETIVSAPVLFFTPESTVIYLLLEQSCVVTPPIPNCISSVNANGDNLQNFIGAPADTTLLAVYNTRALFDLNLSPTTTSLFVSIGGLNTPITGDRATQILNNGAPFINLTMMRIYRDVLQPLPGNYSVFYPLAHSPPFFPAIPSFPFLPLLIESPLCMQCLHFT